MKSIKRIFSWIMATVMLFTICIATPGMEAEAATTTPVQRHGQLSVSGTKIVDQNGQPFQIRGISTHGINWDVGKPYVNQAAFQTLRDDWGVNTVRLAMYTAEYNGYCAGGNQADLKNTIYNGVEYAKNLGMYVIIDWHVLNENPNNYLSQAKVFWNEISAKYKDYNNVIYEICNEPNNCSWDDIKSYANQIIPIIRANDPDAIIIVGTPTWSQLGAQGHTNEVADSPLTGYSNIMYALHFYCAEWAHTQYLPAKVDYAMSKGLPVFVSEFGLSEASGNGSINTAQATAWFNKLDSYGIGYCCWSLSNKAESASLIASYCTKTSGWSDGELSAAGQHIKAEYSARREPDVVVDEEQVLDFVERLYVKVLGRASEANGKAYWTAELCNLRKSGADVGYGFVFSEEYLNKKTSDTQFITMLYQVFMNREPDAGGLAYWKSILNKGVSREYIYHGFATSDEYSNICASYGIQRGTVTLTQGRDINPDLTAYVIRIYEKAMNRSAEEEGLNYWCHTIANKQMTPVQVAEWFIGSPEFTGKNLNDSEYIKILYRTFMGRDADASGLKYWIGRLQAGDSREAVLKDFAGCPEFQGIIAGFGL